MGSYMGTKAELLRAAQFFFSASCVPSSTARSPSPKLRRRSDYLEAGQQFGKVVLEI